MNADKLFEEATLNWRDNKGVGTAFVPAPLNDKVLVYKVLSKMYARSPTMTTIIVVNEFGERNQIIEFLTHQNDEENDAEFKKLINDKLIRIFTVEFLIKGSWHSAATLCIWYKPKEYTKNLGVVLYANKCKFRLIVLSKLFTKADEMKQLYKLAPLLDCFKQSELDALRVSTPVEEMWIDVTIPEDSESWKLYQHYSKYLETTLNIFGSFDKINEARIGNTSLNISSTEICNQIASDNGWNDHLDMNYEYNRAIDDMYNPNALKERASKMYDYIRSRGNLVADYERKLEKILELVRTHSGEKILIINKRGEFANKVTEYLNNNSESDICGNCHNKVDDIEAVDRYENPIFIKSGKEKGKRKIMGWKAQMTLNQDKYNDNQIQCLSLANSPDKSLCVYVDVVIITSPLCEDIEAYLYRLSNVSFNPEKIKLFSIFCKNTIEQQKLFNKSVQQSHMIVNKSEFTDNVENKFDFLIVD